LSGSYGQLLDYIIFAVLVFYILTIVGLFVLRRTHPDGRAALPRDRLSGAAGDLYCDGFVYRCHTIALQTAITWPGLIVVLLGIPVYYAWSRSAGACAHRRQLNN
jgi:basic amino acid/polyamine antiporter, APA family